MTVSDPSHGAVPGGLRGRLAERWARMDRGSTFWPAALMGLVLAGCKISYFGLPVGLSWKFIWYYIQNIAIAMHEDVLYALAAGLVGQGALWALRGRPRAQRAAWWVFIGFCLVSVIYALISVQVFWFLRMPLSYPLLYLAGDMRNMQSSVGSFITPLVVVGLVGTPVAYLAAVVLLGGAALPRDRRLRAGGLVALVAFITVCQIAKHGHWYEVRDDRRIADNPHYVLAASWVKELIGGGAIHLDEPFAPEDQGDFLLVSERPGGAGPTPGLTRGPRNVIVVVLESVATQHLHIYGSPYRTTPRLDAEAGNCLVFDSIYAHFTNTANALAAMLLSVYPPMTWRQITVEHPGMPGDTVPQLLKPLGYRTAFISAGDNAFASQDQFLKGRGFDVVWDCRDSGRERDFSWGVEDRHMVDMMLRWIDQAPGKPFFIFGWNQGTHNPCLVPTDRAEIDFFAQAGRRPGSADLGGWQLNRYLNAIHEADRQLGRLFDALRQRKLDQDTIVLIIGDHGEAYGYPRPNWGHTGKVYQEDLNVPLILWSPRLFAPGRRVETVGAQVDLSPTLADLLGVPLAGSWQGWSLFDPRRPPRAYFYGAMDNLYLAVREGPHKYSLNLTLGRDELYDLKSDPEERNNIAASHAELGRRFRQRLSAWVDYQKRHVR